MSQFGFLPEEFGLAARLERYWLDGHDGTLRYQREPSSGPRSTRPGTAGRRSPHEHRSVLARTSRSSQAAHAANRIHAAMKRERLSP